MKKAMLVIIGIVVGATTGVIASNLMASNITYTPSDTNWGVNNVEAAIDSLYISKTSNNYSTEEKVVGTWIDGKPLYQKTILISNCVIGDAIPLASYIPNIDNAFKLSGFFIKDSIILNEFWNNSSDFLSITINKSSDPNYSWHTRVASHLGNGNSGTLIVTIQYTKTTDTAS